MSKDRTMAEVVDRVDGVIGKFWKPISERIEFKASDGITYEFVDFWDKLGKVRVWQKGNEQNALTLVTKSIHEFSSDDLKNFGVWDSLSDTIKNNIENSVVTKMDIFNQAHPEEKVVKHHKSREEYIGVPRSFVCHECNGTKTFPPAMVLQKAKAKGMTIEEFEKAFICNECKPAPRGKKANPKYANYPRVMKCNHPECTFSTPQQPSLTEKLMTDKGLSLEEYCKSYFCKEHRPKKVHHFTQMKLDREARGEVKPPKTAKKRLGDEVTGEVKRRGRVANPAFDGIPKHLTCTCGATQIQHPSISIKMAEAKGVSLDKYFSDWRCKTHREKKAHHLSKEGRALRNMKGE